jgi:hypothetical protein
VLFSHILEWVTPIASAGALALVTFIAGKIKKLPLVFLTFSENLQAHAKATPGASDDAFAMGLVVVAKAIASTFGQRGDDPLLVPAAVGIQRIPVDTDTTLVTRAPALTPPSTPRPPGFTDPKPRKPF